jgi:cell division transport system permease protein
VSVSVYDVARKVSHLWRHRLMTMAAVLLVLSSLALVDGALLVWQGAANASGTSKRGTELTVWMKPKATAQEIHAVETQLARLSYLRHPCAYWNKARNFAEARKLLPADAIGGATVVKDMPTSFWCMPVVLADANQVISAMKRAPGVETVTIDPADPDR